MDATAASIIESRKPPAIDVPDGADWILGAWRDLSTDRPIAAGLAALMMPIPFSSLDRWARRYGVEGDAFEMLKSVIRSMDAAFLARANARDAKTDESAS